MRPFVAAGCLGMVLLAACASDVKRVAAEAPAAVAESGRRLTTTATVEVVPESGYRRTIAAGTEFVVVGGIAQGLVLKPTQAVLTLEGAHVHEAYAVVRDGQLVGLYLPVERAYAAMPKPVPMTIQERK